MPKVVMCCTVGTFLDLSENQTHGNIRRICQFSHEQSMQSLFSLRFLTLTLSAPPLTGPKVVVAGTSDRIVIMERSEYRDFVIISVAELAHLLDSDTDCVVETPQSLLFLESRILFFIINIYHIYLLRVGSRKGGQQLPITHHSPNSSSSIPTTALGKCTIVL